MPRMETLPWIPGEAEWLQVLDVFRGESARNRLMLALAYDAALRREELCSLRTDDLDPAHRTVRVRAEATKTRRERVVPYSVPTANVDTPSLNQLVNQEIIWAGEPGVTGERSDYPVMPRNSSRSCEKQAMMVGVPPVLADLTSISTFSCQPELIGTRHIADHGNLGWRC